MEAYASFYKNIKQYADFSEEELTKLQSFYSHRTIVKNEIILSSGQVCDFEGYVMKGCFKIFYQDDNFQEHILYFAIEDWWVLDMASFISQKPSQLVIQALEDSVIVYITKEKKEQLYIEMPKIEKLFRIMNQKALAAMQLRMISMLYKTADKRYLEFKNKYPDLDQRIPQHQIASYLGISQEFLSKVRKKLVLKKN